MGKAVCGEPTTSILVRARRRAAAFRKDASGLSTIEFVVWTPLFLALIMLAFDIAIVFHSHSRMYDVARFVARDVAQGELSFGEAETYAISQLPGHANFTVTVTEPQDNVILVTINGSNVSPVFGFIDEFGLSDLTTRFAMRKEDF